jgi:hypothetical protein
MQGNSFISRFMLIFGIIMVVIYIFLGFSLIFMRIFSYIPKEIKFIFGFFFIVYGVFRAARIYFKYKDSRE